MIRLLLPAFLSAAPALAQDLDLRQPTAACETTGGPDSCAPQFGCIGESGRWFRGRAYGWNYGELEAKTSDGVVCAGDWAIHRDGTSRARVTCGDGTTATVTAVYQDPTTGTAIAEGVTSAGERIRSWSGQHVIRFLTPDGAPRAVLPCGNGIELNSDGVPVG